MTDHHPTGVIVGTAGHVDHGKSSLVQALTGVNPDRLQEERDRGLTIELGFARLESTDGPEIGIVDVPGHEDFIRNMLAGATGIDVVLLAVAADEGPMPQTLEHLAIGGLLGIEHGLVALTKSDRVDEEWLDLARRMVRDELHRSGCGTDWPIIPVSVVSGEGLEELRDAIQHVASAVKERARDDLFRLPVDRAFTVRGAGTVVTGSVWSGTVRKGDKVRLLPSGNSSRVRAVQVHGDERLESGVGSRCALSLAGLSLDQSGRGETVVSDPEWRGIRRFGASLSLLPDAGAGLEHAETIRLYHGTMETTARVLLESQDSLAPGSSGWAVLVCGDPVVVRARDRFIIRRVSPLRTIGGGRVADLEPSRRWRDNVALWSELVDADSLRARNAAVLLSGGHGVYPAALPLRTGLPPMAEAEVVGADLIGDRLFAPSVRADARAGILEVLDVAHAEAPRSPGVSLESVRAALSGEFNPVLLESELAGLNRDGSIVREGPDVRLRTHEVRLTSLEASTREQVETVISEAGLSPPAPARLTELLGADRSLINDVLRILVASGRLIAVNPDVYLGSTAEARLVSGARSVLERESPASPAAFSKELGLPRRLLIPLLEYLDRRAVTRRTAEGRIAGDA